MSTKLHGSINTRLTLSSWFCTFMTIFSFSCASTPFESRLEKLIATYLSSFPENSFCETCIIDRVYLFLAKLVGVNCVECYHGFTYLLGTFSLLGGEFLRVWLSPRRLIFLDDPLTYFMYDNNWPLWIRISISLFSWWQSSVWWSLIWW